MAAPFYNAIKGTTSGTPGTGAFTPNAASSGFRAWSTVPTGWTGFVRYEDGAAWSLEYCYWNGTTLSRASTQRFDSSTGSHLTLTSAATAAMVVDPDDIMPDLSGCSWRGWVPSVSVTAPTAIGITTPTVTGSAFVGSIGTTNLINEQMRSGAISATTPANAQAGWTCTDKVALGSATAGRGGWKFKTRFGCTTALPTGPRLFIGLTAATFVANTGEPSAFTQNYAVFAKDSTDTNIQLLVNSGVGTGTKTDTGIALAVNGWYEATIWTEPGSTKVWALLVRIDTGAIWLGSTTTDVPAAGTALFMQLIGGLSATTGTAMEIQFGTTGTRSGP